MDPRDRADAALARARSRGVYVVTPDDAVSPFDAANTQQIPRGTIDAIDQQHPDSTMVISGGVAAGQQQDTQRQPHPQQQHKPPTRPQMAPVQQPRQQQQQPPQPEPEPEPRQLDGLVPTVQQPGTQRGMLSRRLDGD